MTAKEMTPEEIFYYYGEHPEKAPIYPGEAGGVTFRGMSYRQWLVGQVLQGVMASSTDSDGVRGLARLSVEAADIVIEKMKEADK